MALIERDVINRGVGEDGNQTIDFPLARLGWIEDTAEVKAAPGDGDYIPIVDAADGGQMKKTPASTLGGGGGAAQYSSTTAYAIGDYCSHDGKLYRCTTVIPAGGEAWNKAHWKETTVARELQETKVAANTAQKAASDALEAVNELTSVINSIPAQTGTLTYTGSDQSPSWIGYNSEQLALGGVTSGVNAGAYAATFIPKEGFHWADGTKTAKTVYWTIGRASVAVPTQNGTLTYSGSAQSPQWSGYDSAKMTIDGTTSGTNAGSYNATFTPKANFKWPDGSTGAKTAPWSISKAAGSITLDKTSLALNISVLIGTVVVTRPGDGAISASSSNTSVATVQVESTSVKITGLKTGSATISISVAAGTNHTAPASKKVTVSVSLPSKTLADNTPEVIKQTAKSGQAPNYWSVGDKAGIAINGTVGGLTIKGTYYAFILGFNHNASVEGSNSIHFQFGKTSAGVDIAFVDSSYSASDASSGFVMNKGGRTCIGNSGGWSRSNMRNAICPAFLAVMPPAWQDVIAACTKYSDNTCGDYDAASHITSTSDKIWLLSEYEVFSTCKFANATERNYQSCYAYYLNGNSKIKNKHNSTASACGWWLRSVYKYDVDSFCCVSDAGTVGSKVVSTSMAFAPCFMVA